jgi:hypothetical protein
MKRFGIIIMITTLLIMSSFLSYKIIVKLIEKKEENNIVRNMPNFRFLSIDGQILMPCCLQKKTLIVFFNTECECCIDLTKQIINDSIFANNNHVIMVSSENLKTLIYFKDKFNININKIYLCRSDYQDFANLFGNHLMYPSLFLYGANKKLLKKGTGNLNIEDLTHILK